MVAVTMRVELRYVSEEDGVPCVQETELHSTGLPPELYADNSDTPPEVK